MRYFDSMALFDISRVESRYLKAKKQSNMQLATSTRTLKARVNPPEKYLMPLVLSRIKLNLNY